jgi:transcription elongation factor SPT6
MYGLFVQDEFSKNVQEWNNLRGEVVEYALEKLLYPALRKELRAKLLEESKDHVLEACTHKLCHWLKVSPYEIPYSVDDLDDDDKNEWDTSKGIRVLSLAYVPDFTQTSFACIVSHDGEPSDYIRLQNIMKSSKSYNETDRADKEADLLALKELIKTKKPHVIVIGAESRDALMIQEDLKNVVSELVREEEPFPNIAVEILDNQLAKVYSTSNKAAVSPLFAFHEFCSVSFTSLT